jgi:RNA polymerase sigma-70 factor (ECF subfamily)
VGSEEPPFPLSRAVAAAVPWEGETGSDEAEQRLSAGLASARLAWPNLVIPDAHFLRFIGERLEPAGSLAEALGKLELGDLYLACGCARGDRVALGLFDEHILAKLHRTLGRLDLDDARVADVQQTVRMQLFVSGSALPPKIAQYSGRAALSSWVHVVAMRVALRAKSGDARMGGGQDELLVELPTPGDAPEVSYLKQRYQEPFREAFLAALKALPARERTLLRQSFIDGLSIDELGRLYGVHRATAGRWVAQARRTLLFSTRDLMMARIGVSEPECDGIMRLVKSRLDVTLRGLMTNF